MDLHLHQRRRAHDDHPDYVTERVDAVASAGSSFTVGIAIACALAGAVTWLGPAHTEVAPAGMAAGIPAHYAASRPATVGAPEAFDLHIERVLERRMTEPGLRLAQAECSEGAETENF